MPTLQDTFAEEVLEVVCPFRVLARIGLVLAVALGFLLAVSAFYVEPGTPAYVVFVLNIGVIGVTVAGLLGLLWLCNRPYVND